MFSVQNNTAAASQWTQFAFTVDKKRNKVSFHENGESLGSVSGTTQMNENNLSSFQIGHSSITNDFFSGKIGDFKLFNTPLEDSEIVQEKEMHFMPLIKDNEWTHLQVNYSKTRKQADFYKNASKVGSLMNYEVDTSAESNTNKLVVGKGFVGDIGDVNLFERELFETEIHTMVHDPTHYDTLESLFSIRYADYPSMNVVSGKVRGSKALRFDNADTIEKALPDNMDLSLLSAEGWVRPSTTGVVRSLLKITDGANSFFDWSLASDNKMSLTFGSDTVSDTTTAIVVDEWVHLAVRADKRSGFTQFYVNGTMVSAHATTVEAVTATTGLITNVFQSFEGDLDSLNLIAGRISQKEIANRGDLQKDVLVYDVVNTVLEFGFDESGGATTTIDTSTSANHGTVVNGASRVSSYTNDNRGMQFDASQSQEVTVPGAPYEDLDLSISTMSAWVRHEDYADPASDGTILKQTDAFELSVKGENAFSLTLGGNTYETPSAPDLFTNSDVTVHAADKTRMLSGSKWRVYFPSAQNVTDWIEISEFVLTDEYGTYPSAIPAGAGVHAAGQLVNCMNKDYSAYARFNISGGNVNMEYASESFVPTKLLMGVFTDWNRVPKQIKIQSTTDGTTYTDYVTFELPASLVSNTPKNSVFTYDFKFVQEQSYWIHYAVTLDSFNEEIKMYQNGKMVQKYDVPNLSLVCNANEMVMGSGLNGVLDDVNVSTGVEWATRFTIAARKATHNVDPNWGTGIVSADLPTEGISDEQWAHVAAVYERHSNRVCLYHNGSMVGCYKDYLKDFSNPGTNTSNIFLAKDGDEYFDGVMDDVRVYDKCLSMQNVMDLYKMYDPPRKSFESDFTLSFDTDGIHMAGMTLLEPRDMNAGESVDYYIFATGSPFLTDVNQVYEFITDENTPSGVFSKTRVNAQGIPAASSSWTDVTLKQVVMDAASSILYTVVGKAYVYVAAVYGFHKAYYTTHVVQRTSAEPLMNIDRLEFLPESTALSMRGSVFANTVVTERYLMAFESEDPGTILTSASATEQEKLTALYEMAVEKAHTGAVSSSTVDLPPNELHTLENMHLTQVIDKSVDYLMIAKTFLDDNASISVSDSTETVFNFSPSSQAEQIRRYEFDLDFQFDGPFNGMGNLQIGGNSILLIKNQSGMNNQVEEHIFDGTWTKYWKIEISNTGAMTITGYRTSARTAVIWTIEFANSSIVEDNIAFICSIGSSSTIQLSNMKEGAPKMNTLRMASPDEQYNIFMLVKSNDIVYKSEPFIYGKHTIIDRLMATGRQEEGITTLAADVNFPTEILQDFMSESISYLAAGSESAGFVHQGSLYMWGKNQYGQWGNGTTSNTVVKEPVNVSANCPFDPAEIRTLHIGGVTTFVVLNNRQVWGVGYNAQGQLGNGNTTNQSNWVQLDIPTTAPMKRIECGSSTAGFLLENGEMYFTARNTPHGNHTNTTKVTRVVLQWDPDAKIKDFSNTAVTTFILLENGYLYANGERYGGQLGQGNNDSYKYQTKFPSNNSANYFQPGTENEAVSLHGTHRDMVVITRGGHLWKCGNMTITSWGNYENGAYYPNKALRGDQSWHDGKYLEGVKSAYTTSYTVFVVTNDDELYHIGRGTEGVGGRGNTSNKTAPTRVLASPDATTADGPYMRASDVIFPHGHHHSAVMLFGFGYNIGGDVVVPPMRVSSFDASISNTGVNFSAELLQGTNATAYYAFATVRNDLSDAQAKAIALSGAEGILKGTVENRLALDNVKIANVFDANQSLTDSKTVNVASVYLYLKESQGTEQLVSKQMILNADQIFANVNRVEFVPFLNHVEVDTGSFSTSVVVTKFTSALFEPKLLETLTDAEVIAMITAASGTATVQVVDAGSVQVGLFGNASVHFTSYLEADGSVSATSDGPRYEAATVVENADGSQSVLARMHPIVDTATYQLDSEMEVEWTTIQRQSTAASNFNGADVIFTERFCVMCEANGNTLQVWDREPESLSRTYSYTKMTMSTAFNGVTEVCFSQHDMCVLDFAEQMMYIFDFDDVVSTLTPEHNASVVFDPSKHTTKPYFAYQMDLGGCRYNTTDHFLHRCESFIDNNFAAILGKSDGKYMIYVFKKGDPTETDSGWRFFQAIDTEFAPSSDTWTEYRLAVKGDTIFLQPGNQVSTNTKGWCMIYTFVEHEFVYTDTVDFFNISAIYQHNVQNYSFNYLVYSDRYVVWYNRDRSVAANCYAARKRSSLPATIDYELSDNLKSGGTVVVSGDKYQLLFHSTSAAYNHVTLDQLISMDVGNKYTFEFGTKNSNDTVSDVSSVSATFGLCLGGSIPNSGVKGTWGVQLRVSVNATGYTFGDSDAHTGDFPNFWCATVVKREDTGLMDIRLTAYAVESHYGAPVHDLMVSDLAANYADYDGGVATDWFQERYSMIALMNYTTSSANRCVYIKHLKLVEHGDIVGKWESFLLFKSIGNGGEAGGLSLYDKFLYFNQYCNGGQRGHTLSQIVEEPGKLTDGTTTRIFSSRQDFSKSGNYRADIYKNSLGWTGGGSGTTYSLSPILEKIDRPYNFEMSAFKRSMMNIVLDKALISEDGHKLLVDFTMTMAMSNTRWLMFATSSVDMTDQQARDLAYSGDLITVMQYGSGEQGKYVSQKDVELEFLVSRDPATGVCTPHKAAISNFGKVFMYCINAENQEFVTSLEYGVPPESRTAFAAVLDASMDTFEESIKVQVGGISPSAYFTRVYVEAFETPFEDYELAKTKILERMVTQEHTNLGNFLDRTYSLFTVSLADGTTAPPELGKSYQVLVVLMEAGGDTVLGLNTGPRKDSCFLMGLGGNSSYLSNLVSSPELYKVDFAHTLIENIYSYDRGIFVVTKDHNCYAMGDNKYNRMAFPSDHPYRNVEVVDSFQLLTHPQLAGKIKKVGVGNQHCMYLMTDDTLWGCGFNNYGMLATNNTTTYTSPVRPYDNYEDVLDVDCSDMMSVWVMKGGDVYSVGYNHNDSGSNRAQGHNNSTANSRQPRKWGTNQLSGATKTLISQYNTWTIDRSGVLYCTGISGRYRMQNNTGTNIYYARRARGVNNSADPVNGIVDMGGGENWILLLTETGEVYAGGNGANGKLGQNSGTNYDYLMRVLAPEGSGSTYFDEHVKVVKVGGSRETAYAIDSTGALWSWGYNLNNELGHSSGTTSVSLPKMADTKGRKISNMIDGVYGYFNLFVATSPGLPTLGAKIDDLDMTLTSQGMEVSLTVVPSTEFVVEWYAVVSQAEMSPSEVKAAKDTAQLSGTTSDYAGVFLKKSLVPQIIGHDGSTLVDSSIVNDAFLYVYVIDNGKESFNTFVLQQDVEPYTSFQSYTVQEGSLTADISFYSTAADYAQLFIGVFDSRFGVNDLTNDELKALMEASDANLVTVLTNVTAKVPVKHNLQKSQIFDSTGASAVLDPEGLYNIVLVGVASDGTISVTSSDSLPGYLKSKPVNWTYSDLEKSIVTISSNDRFSLGHSISADGKYVVLGGHDSTGGKWRVHVYDETTKSYNSTTEKDWNLGNGRYYARGTSISGDGERIFVTFNNDNDDSIHLWTRSGVNFTDRGRMYKWNDDGYTGWNRYNHCEADYTGDHVLCFGQNKYYSLLRRKEDSQTSYEVVFINHSSSAQSSTYLPGNIRWGYISHDGKMFMIYGWDGTASKMYVRIFAHDEDSDTYKMVYHRNDFTVRDNNIAYTTAAFSPDGRYFAVGLNTNTTNGTVFVYRHTGYSGSNYTYSLLTTINSDVPDITYSNFAYNTALSFSGNSSILLVGASPTVMKIYQLETSGYVYSLNRTITGSANSYVRMSYDGGSFLVPSGKFVYRVNDDPYVLFQLDQVETDFTITDGRLVIQGDFSNAYVFAVKNDPADSAFEKENTKMELETFVENILAGGSADADAYRVFEKATNTILDLSGLQLTKAFESFDAFGDTSASGFLAEDNVVLVVMVQQGGKYFAEYARFVSATLEKQFISWTQMVSEPFLRIEPQNVVTDQATRAISYDSTLIKTTTGGFEEAYLFALANSVSSTMTPAMIEDFVKWTIPFVAYSADELVTVPSSTNTLTTLAAGSFTKAFADLTSMDTVAVDTEIPLNITLPSTHYSGAPAAKSTITAIEGGVELNGLGWKGYHPDLKLTPAIGTHYDLEVHLTEGSETTSDIVVGFMEDQDFSITGSSISPSGGEVNVLWFFKFKPEGVFMAYTEASGGVAEGYALNITDFAQFPRYHRIKFVETSAVAGATGVYALIYELYTDFERTTPFLAMPASTQFLFKGSAMAPSAFTDLPFRVYTYNTVDRTAVVRDLQHSSTFYTDYDLVGVARKEGKYYLQASPGVPSPLFDSASEIHLTERHLVWSDYDNAHTTSHPEGYVNALFPAIKNSTYQANNNGRGGPWGAFNQYYNAASSIPDGWGQAPSSAPYAYLVIDMTLYPGGSPNRKVFSRVKVWGWNEASQYPGDLRIHAADSLEELVTKPVNGEKVFDTFAFEAQRDSGPEISTQHQNEYVFATPLVGRYLLIEISPKSTSIYGINRFEFYGHDHVAPAQLSWSPVISESSMRVDMVATTVADPPSITLSSATIKTKPSGYEKAYVYAVNNLKPVMGKTLDEMAILMAETEATGIHTLAGTTDAMVDLSSITLTQAFDYFLAPASPINPNAPYTTVVVVKKAGEYLVKYSYPDDSVVFNRTINTEITDILTPGSDWNSFDSCLMGDNFMLTTYVTNDRKLMLAKSVVSTGTTLSMSELGAHPDDTSLNYTLSVVYAKSTDRAFVCLSLENVRHELYMADATTMTLMKTEDISATLAGKEFDTTMHYHITAYNDAPMFALIGVPKLNNTTFWGVMFYVYRDQGSFMTYLNGTTTLGSSRYSSAISQAGAIPIRKDEMLVKQSYYETGSYKSTDTKVYRYYFESGILKRENTTYYGTSAQFDSAQRLVENGGIGVSGNTVYFMNNLSSRGWTGDRNHWMYMVSYNLETEERKQMYMFNPSTRRHLFASNTQNWFAAENDEILWLSPSFNADDVSNDLVLQRYEPTLSVYRDTSTPTFTIPDSGASENKRGLVAMLRTASGLLLQRVVDGQLLFRQIGLTEYVPDPAAPVVEDVEVRSSVIITSTTTVQPESMTLEGYALPINSIFEKLNTFAVKRDPSVTYTGETIQSVLHYFLPALTAGSDYQELNDVGFTSLDSLSALKNAFDSPIAPTTQPIVSNTPVSVLKIENKESFNSPQIYEKSGFLPPDYVYTFSGWFYVTEAGGDCTVFLDGGKNGIRIRPNDESSYTIFIYAQAYVEAYVEANYNEWVLITFVSDRYGNHSKCYKNTTNFGGGRDNWARYYEDPNYFGTNYSARDTALWLHSSPLKTTRGDHPDHLDWAWTTSKMVIGNSASNFVNGKFSKFALWHSALTIDDITSLYADAKGWKFTNALYATNNIYSFWSFENTLVDSVNGKDFSGSATYETIGSTDPPTYYSVVGVGKQGDQYYASVFDNSDASSVNVTWEGLVFDAVRATLDNFTIADDALTLSKAAILSTDAMDETTLFAVKSGETTFTSTKIQTIVEHFMLLSTPDEAYVKNVAGVSYLDLSNTVLTHAFTTIDAPDTEPILANTDYVIFTIVKQSDRYTANYYDRVPLVDLELDIANFASDSVPNVGASATSTSFAVAGGVSLEVDADGLSYIRMTQTQSYIDMGTELPLLNSAPTDYTIFYAFRPNTTFPPSGFTDSILFMIHGGDAECTLLRTSATQLRLKLAGSPTVSQYLDINGGDLYKMTLSYKQSTGMHSLRWYNATTSTLEEYEIDAQFASFDQTHFWINSDAAGNRADGQDLYAFKFFTKHLDKLLPVYDLFLSESATVAAPPVLSNVELSWTEEVLNEITTVNLSGLTVENDALTLNTATAFSTNAFSSILVFALKDDGTTTFTMTQLRTMADTYAPTTTMGEAYAMTPSGGNILELSDTVFTHAFTQIHSATVEAIVAGEDYVVVMFVKQGAEEYSVSISGDLSANLYVEPNGNKVIDTKGASNQLLQKQTLSNDNGVFTNVVTNDAGVTLMTLTTEQTADMEPKDTILVHATGVHTEIVVSEESIETKVTQANGNYELTTTDRNGVFISSISSVVQSDSTVITQVDQNNNITETVTYTDGTVEESIIASNGNGTKVIRNSDGAIVSVLDLTRVVAEDGVVTVTEFDSTTGISTVIVTQTDNSKVVTITNADGSQSKEYFDSLGNSILRERYDADGNLILWPRYEVFEQQDKSFTFNYKTHSTDRYMFNKATNYRWCVSNGNEQVPLLFFTWSGYDTTNTKAGVYAMIADPYAEITSDVFEVKYDGTVDYVLPCVTVVNDTTFVVAYKYNNNNYQAKIYYNIITYNGGDLTIGTSTEYNFTTETQDQNSTLDINILDDQRFIIVWNDFSTQARYSHHCGRHCTNHHSGYYYRYDIQYRVLDLTNTNLKDLVVFENNDTASNYHKVCLPVVSTSATHFCVVYQQYQHIYINTFKKSDYAVVSGTKDVNTTDLQTWHHNDCNPVAIESVTPDNFVIAWYDNTYFNHNQVQRVYVREMSANGTFVTAEIKIVETASTDRYYLGRPEIFVNGDGYDLFVVEMKNESAPNYPVKRFRYKLSAAFEVLETIEFDYAVDFELDALEYVGTPTSFIRLEEDKYQESVIHTSSTVATTFGTYDMQIITGQLMSAIMTTTQIEDGVTIVRIIRVMDSSAILTTRSYVSPESNTVVEVTDHIKNTVTETVTRPNNTSTVTTTYHDGSKTIVTLDANGDTVDRKRYDSDGNLILWPRYEVFEQQSKSFTFNYKTHSTDRYMFNKAINYRWSAKNDGNLLFFTWSSMADAQTKAGVYAMIADPYTQMTSDVFEVKYDGAVDYVLPCVTVVNDTTFVVAYKYNNNNYQAKIYYNIITYNGGDLTIGTSTEYNFTTETQDQNSTLDINILDDQRFIIVWNDFSTQARYSHHCGRHCTNHHSGYYYRYDIQYRVLDLTNTNLKDLVVFENNDTASNYHKVCLPVVSTSATHFCVVYQQYQHIYINTFKKSDYAVVSGTKDVNTTDLQTWHHNDCNPVAIESVTPDNFVIAWYDNTYFNHNQVQRVYVREMSANGTFVTAEIKIVETASTDRYYLGRPEIFVNGDGYDLFVVEMKNESAPNYPVKRFRYKLSAAFEVLETIEYVYNDSQQIDFFDVLEYAGTPVSILRLENNEYQESVIHTSSAVSATYGVYNVAISTGESLTAL